MLYEVITDNRESYRHALTTPKAMIAGCHEALRRQIDDMQMHVRNNFV